MSVTLGYRILKWRLERMISQHELADRIPIDQASVSRWESDKRRPRVEHLARIATILRVPLDVLLFGGPKAFEKAVAEERVKPRPEKPKKERDHEPERTDEGSPFN